ncbi:MAG: penicillin acylase family protein [Gammaproteobacteria bacterium]|nr:penicillin acylase family protein [Gammaproteobacteria bacterium]
MLKILRFGLLFVAVLLVGGILYAPYLDSYDPGGTATLKGLSAPVRVVRDEKGMPFIFAETPIDAIRGQGFVAAQDRLFQMEMMRKLGWGRLAEMVGEAGVALDTQVRVWNIPALARRQAGMLNAVERAWHEAYAEGVNAYLAEREGELPRLVSNAQPWTLEDVLAVQFFNIWGSTTNWREELLSQALIDHLGAAQAAKLSQITVNPDSAEGSYTASDYRYLLADLELQADVELSPADGNGSNAWITGSTRSRGGAPIVASDPHIDARRLPGFWHPMGLITPEFRVVGGGTPGVPGIGIGRTNHFAWGVTNGYGDVVDLYVETVDPANPDNYLEGEASIPFVVREEVLRIRDSEAEGGFREETLTIRETRRGPVISDHGMSVASGKLVSLRWAIPEFIGDSMGMRDMLLAKNTRQMLAAAGQLAVSLTYVVADYQGNIARKGTGYIPRRLRGDGAAPFPVTDGVDNWDGRIPGDEMPTVLNPAEDWVGSANHRIVPEDYPHTYSTFFAHSWRYRRLLEAMTAKSTWGTEDHWQLQLDAKNMYAVRLAPLMAAAIVDNEDTRIMGELLQSWNYVDDKEQAAPLVFQSMLRHYARRVVEDDLGEKLAGKYLNDYYYWHERIAAITLAENSEWLDDQRTDAIETREDLFLLAAGDALAELSPTQGADPRNWKWGDIHTITFSHPILRGDAMAQWFGGGTHPMSGSGETLNRAAYKYDDPYEVTFFASMRMVADLSDPDKIEAHIPGGTTDRLFHDQFKDQLPDWITGTPNYWWFSNQAINEHAVSELMLTP